MAGRLSTQRKVLFSLALLLLVAIPLEILARGLPSKQLNLVPPRTQASLMGGAMMTSDVVPGWDLNVEGGTISNMPYTTNRWHMRGPDYPELPREQVRRVIVVGDSTLFGVQLLWEDTYLAQFAARREEANPGVTLQIAACAAPGHSTYQSKAKLKAHCLDFKPDLVILANQNSDTARDTATDVERLALPRFPGLRRFFAHSALYRAIGHQIMMATLTKNQAPVKIGQVGGPAGDVIRVPFEQYQANLAEMLADIRAAGAHAAVLVLPSEGDAALKAPPEQEPLPRYKDELRSFAARESLPLIDAQRWFQATRRGDDLFLDVVHPNAEGSKVLAAFMHSQLPADLPMAR